MQEEIWKDIQGYEGLYQVSNLGRVKRLKFINGTTFFDREIILKQSLNKRGYCFISLSKRNIKCSKAVHRLVSQAFIPNPKNKSEVNHIDGNKQNNNVNNLEWSTREENIQHAYNNGLNLGSMKNKRGIDNPHSKKVYQFDLNGNFIRQYGSAREAERITGIRCSDITMCCRNKTKKSHGFIWKYNCS